MNRQIFFRFFLVLALLGLVSFVCAEGAGLKKKEKGEAVTKEGGKVKEKAEAVNKEGGKVKEKAEVVEAGEGKALGPALGNQDEREEDLFKNFPIPEKCPKIDEVRMDTAKKRYAGLVELYDELGGLVRERHFMLQETDEKQVRKQKRELEKLDKEIFKLKKELVKEAKKLRRPLDRKMEGYLKEKEAHDKKVESAEKGGSDKRAQKLSQEFAKKGTRIEDTQTQIDSINYFLFWNEFVK